MTGIFDPVRLRTRALEALVKELGFANAMRFMLLYEAGAGDYSRERADLLDDWSPEEWLRRSDLARAASPAPVLAESDVMCSGDRPGTEAADDSNH